MLVIIGGGDIFEDLKRLVAERNLHEKVKILGKLPYHDLLKYTQIADLGLSLDKGTNLNYEYSLPNKVFDYIQCQVPLMVSNRKVVADLVRSNNIGIVFEGHHPVQMAEIVKDALSDSDRYNFWKRHLQEAAVKYTWENEARKLKEIVHNLQ